MLFSWDPLKAESNFKKHGISFEMAQTVFDDPFHLSILDHKERGEERWVTIGKISNLKTVIVIHAYRVTSEKHETIRIISARYATKKEAVQYEEGI